MVGEATNMNIFVVALGQLGNAMEVCQTSLLLYHVICKSERWARHRVQATTADLTSSIRDRLQASFLDAVQNETKPITPDRCILQ